MSAPSPFGDPTDVRDPVAAAACFAECEEAMAGGVSGMLARARWVELGRDLPAGVDFLRSTQERRAAQ